MKARQPRTCDCVPTEWTNVIFRVNARCFDAGCVPRYAVFLRALGSQLGAFASVRGTTRQARDPAEGPGGLQLDSRHRRPRASARRPAEGLILCNKYLPIYLFSDTEEVLVSQTSDCPCVNLL